MRRRQLQAALLVIRQLGHLRGQALALPALLGQPALDLGSEVAARGLRRNRHAQLQRDAAGRPVAHGHAQLPHRWRWWRWQSAR